MRCLSAEIFNENNRTTIRLARKIISSQVPSTRLLDTCISNPYWLGVAEKRLARGSLSWAMQENYRETEEIRTLMRIVKRKSVV